MADLNTFELARLDEQLQKEVNAWGIIKRDQLIRRLMSLNLRQKVSLTEALQRRRISEKWRPLEKTIRSKVFTKDGWIDSIGQSFARKGIYLEHGVGRGRSVRSAAANSAKRAWLKPVLDPAVEELADLLAEKYADLAVGSVRLLIPGIIDTKIQYGS